MAIKINFKIPSLGIRFQELLKKKARVKFRGVGLFIGKEFVDLVELRRTFSGPRLVNFVSVPIAPQAVPLEVSSQESAIFPPPEEVTSSSPEQILSAIRKAIRESGLRGRKVVSMLSEEEVIVRYFQMPRLPSKDWNQAVRFEARKYIPFTLDELVSDFSVTDDKKDKGKMNVVFVAAKKEVVSRHLALFTKANLQVVHLETLSVSFMRLLYSIDPEAKKEKCICIVDIDGLSGSIMLIKEGLPYLVRRISLEEAQREEIHASEKGPQESPLFPPLVEKLLNEVRLTVRYYRNQFPNENLNRVFIFGDGLKADMLPLLTQELNLPVIVRDLSRIVGSREVIPMRLARTIGLGLRDLTGEGPEIELLLPKESAPSFKQTKLFKTILLESAGAIGVLFALFLILSHHIATQRTLLEKARGKQAVAATISKAELDKKKATLAQKAAFYQEHFNKRVFWTKKLNQLGNILPKGAWISNFRVEDHTDDEGTHDEFDYRLSLKGSVYSPDKTEELKVPSQFLAAIQQNEGFFEGFSEAKLVSVKRDVVEDVSVTTFEIVMTGKKK